MIRALAAAPLLAALACGGAGTALGGDAAAPAEAGGEVGGTVPTRCELASQTGCAADQQCSPICESQQLVVACRAEPAAPTGLGEPCMDVPCVRGTVCLATAGMPTTCKRVCTDGLDCALGQACRDFTVTYGCALIGPNSIRIKVCL